MFLKIEDKRMEIIKRFGILNPEITQRRTALVKLDSEIGENLVLTSAIKIKPYPYHVLARNLERTPEDLSKNCLKLRK